MHKSTVMLPHIHLLLSNAIFTNQPWFEMFLLSMHQINSWVSKIYAVHYNCITVLVFFVYSVSVAAVPCMHVHKLICTCTTLYAYFYLSMVVDSGSDLDPCNIFKESIITRFICRLSDQLHTVFTLQTAPYSCMKDWGCQGLAPILYTVERRKHSLISKEVQIYAIPKFAYCYK